MGPRPAQPPPDLQALLTQKLTFTGETRLTPAPTVQAPALALQGKSAAAAPEVVH